MASLCVTKIDYLPLWHFFVRMKDGTELHPSRGDNVALIKTRKKNDANVIVVTTMEVEDEVAFERRLQYTVQSHMRFYPFANCESALVPIFITDAFTCSVQTVLFVCLAATALLCSQSIFFLILFVLCLLALGTAPRVYSR